MIISKRIITELEYQYRKTFSDELNVTATKNCPKLNGMFCP